MFDIIIALIHGYEQEVIKGISSKWSLLIFSLIEECETITSNERQALLEKLNAVDALAAKLGV